MAPWVVGACVVVLAGCRINFDPIAEGVDDAGGSTDRDVLPATDCPPFALFCEDFESGDLNRWDSTELGGTGAMAIVQGARVRRGAFALEARVGTSSNNGKAGVFVRIPEQASSALAVRQWINLGSPLENFNLIVVLRHDATTDYVTAGGNNSTNWVSTEVEGVDSVDHHSMTATPPLDTWTCVELVFTFGATPRVQIYASDVLVLDEVSVYTSIAFNEVGLGVVRSGPAGFWLFADDIVIADRRIGCP